MKEITIDETSSNQRYDRFLRKYFKHTPEITLGDIFSWIRKWSIKVNKTKKKQNYRLQEWDIIAWDEAVLTKNNAEKYQRKKSQKIAEVSLDYLKNFIVAETEHLLIRDKPPHLLIHPWDKHTTDLTMHDYMVSYLKQTDQRNATETYTPSMCYRLDKDTSWVVISAKTYEALQYMNKIIREREVEKRYTTILVGDLRKWSHKQARKWVSEKVWQTKGHPEWNEGSRIHENKWKRSSGYFTAFSMTEKDKNWIVVNAPLFVWYNRSSWRSQTFVNQEKWKESHTTFYIKKVIDHNILWPITMCRVKLWTGRMHQIRVHAAHIWYPVLWDLTYWIPPINRKATKKCQCTRQLLHASTYWFFDTFSDTYTSYTAPLPHEFSSFFEH